MTKLNWRKRVSIELWTASETHLQLAATPHILALVQPDYGDYTGLVWSHYYLGAALASMSLLLLSVKRGKYIKTFITALNVGTATLSNIQAICTGLCNKAWLIYLLVLTSIYLYLVKCFTGKIVKLNGVKVTPKSGEKCVVPEHVI